MSDKQPEALRLAEAMKQRVIPRWVHATGEAPRQSGYAADAECQAAAAELRRLHAECEAVRADLAEQCRLLGMGGEREARLMAERAELRAECERLRADAERWRCFRTFVAGKSTRGFLNGKPAAYMVLPAITVERVGMTLDESIDAARAAKEQSK